MERKAGCVTTGGQSGKRKSRTNKVNLDKTDKREPLREKTQEVVNQQIVLSDHKKKKKVPGATPSLIHAHEKLKELTGSGKVFKKEVSKTCKPKEAGLGKKVVQLNNFQSSNHQKIAKLLLNNQENNFIDKKLKEIQPSLKKPAKQETQILQNKSQSNIHKSLEKSMSKVVTVN
jgi:hypothetical protein